MWAVPLFIAAFLAGLMAKPRWRGYLLPAGFLIVAVGVVSIYLPGYWWGDAAYRLAFRGFAPVAGGVGLSLGVLARAVADFWPVLDSSFWWPRCLRVLLAISVFVFGSFGLLVGAVILGREPIQRQQRFEKADVRAVFLKGAKEGVLISSFDPAQDFLVASRHGLSPFIVSFLNAAGQKEAFWVVSVPDGWEFRIMGEGRTNAKVVLPREQFPY